MGFSLLRKIYCAAVDVLPLLIVWLWENLPVLVSQNLFEG